MDYLKELDKLIDQIPESIKELKDCDITVSSDIYKNIKDSLKDGKYKDHRIFTSYILPKQYMITGSLYHK